MTKQAKEIAEILRTDIYYAGQVGDFVIRGAIEKLIERERSLSIAFAEFISGEYLTIFRVRRIAWIVHSASEEFLFLKREPSS